MIVNGAGLLIAAPIKNMIGEKHRFNGVSHGLAEAGYDIRVAQDIMFDPNIGSKGQISIVDGDKRQLIKGNFTIASSVEQFQMPNDLVGVVHDKSTWARKGLSVFNTVLEPGWSGGLTLELVYHGQDILVIPAGTGIAQVLFHKIAEQGFYSGKYQNQSSEPVSAIFEKG